MHNTYIARAPLAFKVHKNAHIARHVGSSTMHSSGPNEKGKVLVPRCALGVFIILVGRTLIGKTFVFGTKLYDLYFTISCVISMHGKHEHLFLSRLNLCNVHVANLNLFCGLNKLCFELYF